MLLRILLGALLGAIVCGIAARARVLSTSGAVAAAAIGTLAVSAGWSWAIVLLVFFTLTSTLSALGAESKRQLMRGILAKGGRRDAAQVLANGGVFAIAALGWLFAPTDYWLAAGAGALAAAAADSWATETGITLGGEPRSIITGKPIARGISGGVTLPGSVGAGAGAATIAGTVLIIGWPVSVAATAFFAGLLGMIIDSVLGATLQVRRSCSFCGTETEQAVHNCGRATDALRGVRWMDNDMVNMLATLSGAAIAVIAHVASA